MKRKKVQPRQKAAAAQGPFTHAGLILAVLAFALAARVYYFFLTNGQAVWWDEAEYLIKARSIATGLPDTGFFSGRPILLSVIMSGIYAIGLGETTIRILFVLLSLATVLLTYRVGRKLVGELAGVVAALLFSVHYIPVFFGNRVMTEVPQLAFCLLAVDLFLDGRRWATVASLPVLVLGCLTRFPSAILVPILLVAAVLRERLALLRNRWLWLSAGLAVLTGLPYLLWAYFKYGDPLAAWHASQFHIPHLTLGDRLEGLLFYVEWLQFSLGWMLSALAVVGLAVSVVRAPLLALWALVPVLYFGAFLRPLEDRFVILSLPPLFIAIGWALEWAARLAARRHPVVQTVAVVAVALIGAVPLLGYSDFMIHSKLDSYAGLKDAGRWLKVNTAPGTMIMTTSQSQITYYSERPTMKVPNKVEPFKDALAASKTHHIVLSAYEQPPGFLKKTKPESFGLRGIMGFPAARPEAVVFAYP